MTALSIAAPNHGFDLKQLTELLMRHRLARLQTHGAPGELVDTLVEAFEASTAIFALRGAIEGEAGVHPPLIAAALREALGCSSCRIVFGTQPQPVSDMALHIAIQSNTGMIGILEIIGFENPTAAALSLAETAAHFIGAVALHGGVVCQRADTPPFRVTESPSTSDISGRELILTKILAVATDVLDADRGAIFLYDAPADELVARNIEGIGKRELRINPQYGVVGAAFGRGEILNVADAYRDARFHPALDERIGYRTRNTLCTPIFSESGHRVGVVQMLNKRRGNFTAADERRLKGLASQMGVTIDYASLFEQTLQLKSYNEHMLRSLSNGVLTIDLAQTITFMNHAAAHILGVDAETAVGRALDDVFAGLNGWVVAAVGEANASSRERQLPNSEFYIETEDSWVSANVSLIPLIDSSRLPLGTMIVMEDLQREKELRRTMSRYLSNEVIDRLMLDPSAGLGGSSHDVTILFSDIRGFTSMTERLGASETVSMLNEYFSFMEDVVTNRSGLIDKYIGDAIMALFGSPFPTEGDADNAVQAAIDMHKALELLNHRRAAEGAAAIRIGVGIGTGTVITGNIGSPKRMDFTVIGDAVNLASRVEYATKVYGAGILVCGTTWSRLAKPPRARRLDVVRLRGQTHMTELWEIIEHRHDLTEAGLAYYAEGLNAFSNGQWGVALDKFEHAKLESLEDRAAIAMARRCRAYRWAPPEEWDGAVNLE
ncbi:MAG: GAF domain-containing protein [Alphaproteobacteria bacterium]|nr:GAF domain-containing protein [Alphaproteobacteria bacterium]